MSSRVIALLAAVAAGCLCGSLAIAEGEGAPNQAPATTSAPAALRGWVVGVNLDKSILRIRVLGVGGDGLNVTTDKDTKVTINGKDAKLADIIVDRKVEAEITPATGVAKTVIVTSTLTVLSRKVLSVDAAKGALVLRQDDGRGFTVTTDKDTKVTVEGMDAKLDDVKADMMAEVAPPMGVAKTIVAKTGAVRR